MANAHSETAYSGQQNATASWIVAKVAEATSYGFQPDMDDDTRELADETWIRLLKPFSREEITHAFDMHGRNQPSKKPTPYNIESMCKARREKQFRFSAMQPLQLDRALPRPDEPRITAERAAEICAEYGYTPNLSQALKRFPRATSRTQAVELNEKPADALPREAYMTPDEIRAEDERA